MSDSAVNPLIEQAAQAFTERSGVPVRVLAPRHASGVADLKINFLGAKPLRLPVVVVPTLDRRSRLEAVKAMAQRHPLGQLVLVTSHLSAGMLAQCRALGIAALDGSGNAYVHSGSALVFISGHARAPKHRRNKAKAWTAKGLQVLFALLTNPDLLGANLRNIATASGVSLGTAQQVIGDLIARNKAVRIGDHLTLTDPAGLLNEWVLLYPARLRRSLGRFADPDPDWSKAVDLSDTGCEWSGEVAAAWLTGYLKPVTATIYSGVGLPNTLIVSARLRKDESGPIEFFESFADAPAPHGYPPNLVHPLLVYADLMASGDSRNIETARLIREQYLAIPNS